MPKAIVVKSHTPIDKGLELTLDSTGSGRGRPNWQEVYKFLEGHPTIENLRVSSVGFSIEPLKKWAVENAVKLIVAGSLVEAEKNNPTPEPPEKLIGRTVEVEPSEITDASGRTFGSTWLFNKGK
jgi:hypothetical protein